MATTSKVISSLDKSSYIQGEMVDLHQFILDYFKQLRLYKVYESKMNLK